MPPRQAKNKKILTTRRHKKPPRPHLNLRTTEGTSRGMPLPPPQTPPTIPRTPTQHDSSSVSFADPRPTSVPTPATPSSASRPLKRPWPDTPYPSFGARARSKDDALTPPPASADSPCPGLGANSGANSAANSNKRPRVNTDMSPPRSEAAAPVPALVDDLFAPQPHAPPLPPPPPPPPPMASGAQATLTWTNSDHLTLFRHVSAHGATRWGGAVAGRTASESEDVWRDTVEPFIVAQLLGREGGPGRE